MTMTFGTPPPPPKHQCIVRKSTRWACINGVWECVTCREKKARAYKWADTTISYQAL